jgi:dipeptidyl aminopeptidase/acylaminoacyl peptidase
MMKRFVLIIAATAFGALLTCGAALAAVSARSDPGTVNTNGRVSAVLRVGDRIYLAGNFFYVNGVFRPRLAAVDADTGELTSWNPKANGPVNALAVSDDGSRVFAGGEFTEAGEAAHNRLAAIDAASGTVDGTWNPSANFTVNTLDVSGSRVYLGGGFSSVNGQSRSRLAMVDGITGELDPGWRPAASGGVRKLDVSSDGTRVYVGGEFRRISQASRVHLAAVDAASGAPLGWRPDPKRSVLDFAISGKRVYAAEGGRGGGAVAAYQTGTGHRAWTLGTDGDGQAVSVLGKKVYVGGHFTKVGKAKRVRLAAVNSRRGTLDRRWQPSANSDVWELTPDAADGRLYAGGAFTRISGAPREHFAQFSRDE